VSTARRADRVGRRRVKARRRLQGSGPIAHQRGMLVAAAVVELVMQRLHQHRPPRG
jgi:hypothetical protein